MIEQLIILALALIIFIIAPILIFRLIVALNKMSKDMNIEVDCENEIRLAKNTKFRNKIKVIFGRSKEPKPEDKPEHSHEEMDSDEDEVI